jgi:hypothetical protein
VRDFLNTHRRRAGGGELRNFALHALAFIVVSCATPGCANKDSPTAVDLTVRLEPALAIDNVDVAIRAPGKNDKHLTLAPAGVILVSIHTTDLATGTTVSLEVSGIKGGTTIVLARARHADHGPPRPRHRRADRSLPRGALLRCQSKLRRWNLRSHRHRERGRGLGLGCHGGGRDLRWRFRT